MAKESRLIIRWFGLLAVAVLLLLGPTASSAAVIPGFEVSCPYSHTGRNDPIVYPGQPGVGHLHEFYGNTGTDAFSTPTSLRTGGTTCELAADRSGYWSPAVYSGGVRLVPLRLHSYYRWGQVADLSSINALPTDAALIAGDHHATQPPPVSVLGWNCGGQGESQASRPKDCRGTHHGRHDTSIEVAHLFFPNCLRGDPGIPASYSYSHHGSCPSGSRPVVRLSYDVAYPAKAPSSYMVAGTDASGGPTTTDPIYTFHADFLNGWDQAVLERLVHDCIQANRQCGPLR